MISAAAGGVGARRSETKVGDREVDLMPHGRDDGQDRDAGDRARQIFVVEAPEILDAAAAAREHDDLPQGAAVSQLEPPEDLARGLVALDDGRDHGHAHLGRAPALDIEHVLDRRARRRGDHREPRAERLGERSLARARIEKPFGREPGLELLEGDLKRARAERLDVRSSVS